MESMSACHREMVQPGVVLGQWWHHLDDGRIQKVSHRALIFSCGKLIAEIDRKNINVANLTSLAAGARGAFEPAIWRRRASCATLSGFRSTC